MSNENKQFNNWGEKIAEWATSDKGTAGDANLKAFNATLDSSLSTTEERLQTILLTPNSIILAVSEDNKVYALHNAKNLGNSLTRPTSKVIALRGLGFDAAAVEIDVDSALKDFQSKVAKFGEITGKSMEDLKNLELSRTMAGCAHLSGMCIPPPFLAKEIVEFAKGQEEEKWDPMELLGLAIQSAKAFDVEHSGDDSYPEGGLENSEYTCRWLLSVLKKVVQPTVLKTIENDEELKTYHSSLHDIFYLL